MFVVLPLLLCLAAFHCTVSAELLSEYAHHAVLDAEEKMKLFWTIDWDAKSVSFALEAETTGWVGFGFSTGSGQMVGSDVVIGWVKDNKGYLTVRCNISNTGNSVLSDIQTRRSRVFFNPLQGVGIPFSESSFS